MVQIELLRPTARAVEAQASQADDSAEGEIGQTAGDVVDALNGELLGGEGGDAAPSAEMEAKSDVLPADDHEGKRTGDDTG